MEKYNGWTNRETWLANMYFDETISEFLRHNQDCTASELKDWFMEILEEIYNVSELPEFIQDYIDFASINYYEILEHHIDIIKVEEAEAA